ncbi:hypothetical protein AB0K09_00295 [Streptomyces sp. NPDC049577]|uniref:LppU/SCO3897 family protein n=1 Tax=Streptomyces sp. NPDC049577 TaxID=3155153 RepID=UPI00342B7C3E
MTTPPPPQPNPHAPQGGNPYGQPTPPPPYGQQPGQFPQQPGPYGQQPPGPYGQQPGQPVPPPPYGQQQPGAWGGAPVPPAAPSRGKKIGKKIGGIVLALIASVGFYVVKHVITDDDTTSLSVGDCLQNKGTDNKPDIKKVDCSDSKAQHKVLKKVDGSTLYTLACQNVEGTTAALTWQERSDKFTLCLTDVKK